MGMKNAMLARGSLDREDDDYSVVSGWLSYFEGIHVVSPLPWTSILGMVEIPPVCFLDFFLWNTFNKPLVVLAPGSLTLQLRAAAPAGMCIRLSLVLSCAGLGLGSVDSLMTKTFFLNSAWARLQIYHIWRFPENGGTMVYQGKSHSNGWFGGTSILGDCLISVLIHWYKLSWLPIQPSHLLDLGP